MFVLTLEGRKKIPRTERKDILKKNKKKIEESYQCRKSSVRKNLFTNDLIIMIN